MLKVALVLFVVCSMCVKHPFMSHFQRSFDIQEFFILFERWKTIMQQMREKCCAIININHQSKIVDNFVVLLIFCHNSLKILGNRLYLFMRHRKRNGSLNGQRNVKEHFKISKSYCILMPMAREKFRLESNNSKLSS